jgi:hypothetical protein
MAIQTKNKARFAMEGFRVRRCNPDGTEVRADRMVGFSDTVDITDVIDAAKKAKVKIKAGAGAWQEKEITFDTINVEAFTESLATLDIGQYVASPSGAGKTYADQLEDMEEAAATDFDEDGINAALMGITPVSKSGSDYTFDIEDVLEVLAFHTTNSTFKTQLAAMISNAATIFSSSTVVVTSESVPEAIDPEKLSVAQAVAIFSSAGFTGIDVGVDTYGQRLKLSTTLSDIQIKGKLASALDFGQGITYSGLGSYWLTYLNDESISCALPNNMKDKEEIDLEGAKGGITRMVLPAKRLGVSPAIVFKYKNDELTQLIQGGVWTPPTDTKPGIYDPPASDAGGSPMLTLDVFAPLYSDGASQMDQVIGMDRRLYHSVTGIEGDVPMEAKSWAQFAYNMTATEYTDEAGKKYPADRRYEYDLTQWQAMNFAAIGAAE